ncbi:MAG: hypothetical protein AAF196_07410 [Planctomycetota bacterium]
MVKKSRFLDKIKDRMRTGGVRVESEKGAADRAAQGRQTTQARTGSGDVRSGNVRSGNVGTGKADSSRAGSRVGTTVTGSSAPKAEPKPAEPTRSPAEPTRKVDAVARRAAEAKVARKLSPKEDASLAMRDGFQELGSLLRGMQSRIDSQGEQIARTVESVNQLPAIGQQQLETLRRLADRFDRQSEQTAVLTRSLGDLPQTLKSVQESLDRAAATDERQAKSLDEFRTNMARINESMEKMVDHSKSQSEATQSLVSAEKEALTESFDGFAKSQKSATEDAAARLGAAHDRGVKVLSQIQEQHAEKLNQLAESNQKANRPVIVLLSLVLVALIVVAALLATA